MPDSTTVIHNDVQMTFTEDDHSYIDSKDRHYTSVTTLISKAFEKFDAEKIAKEKASREGTDWQEYVRKWEENGQRAANFGTRLHQNCENLILENYDSLHEPVTEDEKIKFRLAENVVRKIKNDENNISFEPEKLIFSPKLLLAGTIDLLVERNDDSFIIYDWKNIKELKKFGFNNKCGILEMTKNVQDSNYWHYAMQLQTYEIILKAEKYIPANAKVKRILNVFESGTFNQYELPSMCRVITELIKWNFKNGI